MDVYRLPFTVLQKFSCIVHVLPFTVYRARFTAYRLPIVS
jgi:hypothetical protein